jgi:hypothetical protein
VIFPAKQTKSSQPKLHKIVKKLGEFKKVCTFSPLRHHNKGLKVTSVEKATKYGVRFERAPLQGQPRWDLIK